MESRDKKEKEMKKKFSPETLVFVIGAILLIIGSVYIVSTRITGEVVAPNGPRCTDSDGGQAFNLAGRCLQYTGGRGKIQSLNEDKCLDTKTLVEYYCSSKSLGIIVPTCTGQIATCPNGCGVYQEGSRCN